MDSVPDHPPLAGVAEDLLAGGHVWQYELVEGDWLRFQVEPSGLIRFGDAARTYEDPEAMPPAYRYAVESVRRRLDRTALRCAVEDVRTVTCCGIATYRETLAYAWDRLPGFLGTHVLVDGRTRPPDAVEQIYEALGLEPAPAIAREQHVRDLSVETMSAPPSAWRDGPAAGVLIRRKGGGTAIWRPDSPPAPDPEPHLEARTGPSLSDRFEAILAEDPGVDVDELAARALAAGYREIPALRTIPDEDLTTLRGELNERASRFLATRP